MYFQKPKVGALLTLAAFSLFAAQCVAGDTVAVSRYSLVYTKISATLKVEFITSQARVPAIKDTSKATVFGNPPRKYSDEDGIQKQLYKLITGNNGLELANTYPDYIDAIIDLVEGEKKKAKARHIYDKEKYEFPVNRATGCSISTENGASKGSCQLTYTCVLIVKKETRLMVPEFILTDGVNIYYTQPMVIEFKNTGS